MDNREVVGSWLSGPRAAAEQMGVEFGYRGERLGLPEDGPGSIASIGRRVAAIFIDWVLCVVIAYGLIAHRNVHTANNWALVVFGAVSLIGLALVGSTPGKLITRLRVIGVDGRRLSPLAALIRTVLLLLVVPAVVWDRDTRGLHDKAAKAVQVRI
ncbi:RDD family protein [Streptomyces sp. NBC_00669]|uniref:RDD family protein n=1 Tax=unclassified Streptomyces TaxID=2593676 RepID=UPI002E1EE4AB|nr:MULTISPECIES: RDD family protein [unclassified Streptomyces]